MFLKLKASINTIGLLLCSQEQKKKFSLDLNKITWRGKSSCNEQGASAIGLVITTFFIFLLILLPMNLFVQELNLFRSINHKVQMATEMACFDAFIYLEANALSEETLVLDGRIAELFDINLKARIARMDTIDIDIENLTVVFLTNRHPNRLQVKFEFPYDTQFVLKGHLTKKVGIELSYELPLNN